MTRTFIVLLLLATVFGAKLGWSNLFSPISYPAASKAVYVYDLNNGAWQDVIPGYKWIWDNDGKNTPKGDRIDVEHKFWAKCQGDLTLTIAAFGNWFVWLDGTLVKSGNTWQQATEIDLGSVKCGKHILKIRVVKTSSTTPNRAGLVYLFEQDDSKCKCSSNKWWNPYKCACECLHKCDCPAEKYWSTSRCACVCKPPRQTTSSSTGSVNVLIAKASRCPHGQFWDPSSCRCMCYPKWCPDGWSYKRIPEKTAPYCDCWVAIP